MAGNVAEWVERVPEPNGGGAANVGGDASGVAKGGSWASAFAADLRVWAKVELDPKVGDPRVGVRCAYPP
jgi:formylglycine-generating enzyme required for sulfatase activity